MNNGHHHNAGDTHMITMTYELAMAASSDAGNRSMRKAGRSRWNEEDWNAAVEAFVAMYPSGTSATGKSSDDAIMEEDSDG